MAEGGKGTASYPLSVGENALTNSVGNIDPRCIVMTRLFGTQTLRGYHKGKPTMRRRRKVTGLS